MGWRGRSNLDLEGGRIGIIVASWYLACCDR